MGKRKRKRKKRKLYFIIFFLILINFFGFGMEQSESFLKSIYIRKFMGFDLENIEKN
jgi:hypothetical protein